jgi:hypothetical protein
MPGISRSNDAEEDIRKVRHHSYNLHPDWRSGFQPVLNLIDRREEVEHKRHHAPMKEPMLGLLSFVDPFAAVFAFGGAGLNLFCAIRAFNLHAVCLVAYWSGASSISPFCIWPGSSVPAMS